MTRVPSGESFEEIKGRITELSAFNLSVVGCFKDLIKYNAKLEHLNLDSCGLSSAAIKYIAALLRKSQALRCLHLSGNHGLSSEVIEGVRERLHAKPARFSPIFEPFTASSQAKVGPHYRRQVMNVNRFNTTELLEDSSKRKAQEWRDIQRGLKLRSIVQSKRANEAAKGKATTPNDGNLLIQRHLGLRSVMPGSS